MNISIQNTRDMWAGLLYLAFAVIGLYIGSGYRMGTAAAMGPGYFPMALSALLACFGVASIVRSLLSPGESVTQLAWKPALFILGSIAVFALTVEPLGLPIALTALMLIGAAASCHFRADIKAALCLVAFVALCALVFVHWLHVPMPLLGTWFGG